MSSPTDKKPHYSVLPVVRVFARHLKKYRLSTGFIALGTAINELLQSIALPYVGKLLFDNLAQATQTANMLPQTTRIIYLLGSISIGAWTLNRITNYLIIKMQVSMMADLEQSSFAYMLGHAYQFFQDNFSGSLVRRITRISRAFEDIADNIQQKLIPIVISCVGIVYVLFQRNHFIGGIVFLWIVAMLAYNYAYSRWKIGNDIERAAQDSKATGFLADVLSNVLTIKLFTGIKRETESYRQESNLLRKLRLRSWMAHEWNYSLQSFILIVVQISILLVAVRYWIAGKISAGDIVLFQSYFAILNSKMLDFSRMIRSLYNGFADATEMVEILDKPHAVQDRKDAKKLRVTKGDLTFDHVTFSYQATNVLNDFNLTIKSGEKIALVGSSGAGKSTIVKLLFRFYDVTHGSIQIDGQAIDKITQDSLRANIALVPQEPLLFHRSLLENIRYGRPDASEKEVIRAAKLAHCDEFIQHFPLKYQTFVGERGVKLSGGERQRIAIARAILKNAPILVLDEATSSLDSESEQLIQDALQTLMKEKTTIVIAHRLSTIMAMDRIIIMDQGKVVDIGTHDDLLSREGIYKKLWNIQVGGFFQDQDEAA